MAEGALRVLLVTGEYPPMQGGVADYTRILGEEMAAQGAEVHVLTSPEGRGPAGSPVTVHATMKDWGWRSLRAALKRLRAEVRPDVVNIQYQTAAYAMHPAVNALPLLAPGLPVVTTFHDLKVPYLFPKAGPVRWWANLALVGGSRAVIVTNVQDRERLAGYSWLRNMRMIPIGSNVPCAPPADFDAAAWRRLLGLSPEALLLCYFGFLNASKGGEELVEALGRLVEQGYDAHLLMIGGSVGASDPTNAAYLETVRALIKRLGLGKRVVWTGHLRDPEVSASFVASDLCVLPYRDGVSYRRGSFMAALAHSMPIVTTEPQAPQPWLAHGENVWLVRVNDAVALASGCAQIAAAPQLRQALARGAAELHTHFSWPEIAAATLEVLHDVSAR
ncbi:MAG: glycosyltransferase family 4 protein [Chloroflexi bacterium]|nr:glycosyltransferase family 4 protein [Chloroflexota bacterium]